MNAIDMGDHALACHCDDCLEWLHSHHEMDGHHADDCPLCEGQPLPHNPPIIDQRPCYTCKPGEGVMRELTGRHRTIMPADPTDSYELSCGHWGI